jgi:hypothetical protein
MDVVFSLILYNQVVDGMDEIIFFLREGGGLELMHGLFSRELRIVLQIGNTHRVVEGCSLSFKKLHAVLRLELFQLRSIWEK